MPLPEEPEKELSLRSEKTDTVKKRMEYMSFDGTVTMLLRVVAPQTPVMIDGF